MENVQEIISLKLTEGEGGKQPAGKIIWEQILEAILDLPTKNWVQSLGQEDLLEEEMATYSTILAWKIPCTEEPSGLQSMGSQRIGYK